MNQYCNIHWWWGHVSKARGERNVVVEGGVGDWGIRVGLPEKVTFK